MLLCDRTWVLSSQFIHYKPCINLHLGIHFCTLGVLHNGVTVFQCIQHWKRGSLYNPSQFSTNHKQYHKLLSGIQRLSVSMPYSTNKLVFYSETLTQNSLYHHRLFPSSSFYEGTHMQRLGFQGGGARGDCCVLRSGKKIILYIRKMILYAKKSEPNWVNDCDF